VASLVICEVPLSLEAKVHTRGKNSGKPLIFCYLTHLLILSDDVAPARKPSQKPRLRIVKLYFALRSSGHRRHSKPTAGIVPRTR
jgi:hypothetical protein